MKATKEEAERVVADLQEKAQAERDTQLGRRAAQALHNAAAMIEMTYKIGHFA